MRQRLNYIITLIMTKKKRTAKQVLERLVALSDYLNGFSDGVYTKTNEELMQDLPQYTDRKQIQRDLKRLEDLRYIDIKIEVKTPVSVSNGTAQQYVRRYRTITFNPSDDGLRGLPKKLEPGDVIGKGMYQGQEITYTVEGTTNTEWIIGPDHTLIKNPSKL